MAGITTILFDFDGTLSTLRAGWEEVMAPFMKACITGGIPLSEEEDAILDQEIARYIDESTGIQTIYQMRWLAETVKRKGWNHQVHDEWTYKAEYNRRLLQQVSDKVNVLEQGQRQADDFLIKGSVSFLTVLQDRGIRMFVASGTDHPDVVKECRLLGLFHFFEHVEGAPVGKAACSKEKVMTDLMRQHGLSGNQIAVIGDGKVEIGLAKERHSLAIGLASNEVTREGINPVKEKRLLLAGADWIRGDFTNTQAWMEVLGLPSCTHVSEMEGGESR